MNCNRVSSFSKIQLVLRTSSHRLIVWRPDNGLYKQTSEAPNHGEQLPHKKHAPLPPLKSRTVLPLLSIDLPLEPPPHTHHLLQEVLWLWMYQEPAPVLLRQRRMAIASVENVTIVGSWDTWLSTAQAQVVAPAPLL